MLSKLGTRSKVPIGTMVIGMRSPNIVRILKASGFDFFVVDCEHGSFSFETVENMMAVARGVGMPGLVRVPEIRREPVLKVLEAGASGLLVPQVRCREEVEKLVSFAKYAPQGMRGVSLTRPHTGYVGIRVGEYIKRANEETIILLQIECREAIENLEAMLGVPGVDGLIIGPNDLSQSLGVPGETGLPLVVESIERVIGVAGKYGIPVGIHVSDRDTLVAWLKKGMTIGMWNSEIGMILSAAREGLAAIRELLST